MKTRMKNIHLGLTLFVLLSATSAFADSMVSPPFDSADGAVITEAPVGTYFWVSLNSRFRFDGDMVLSDDVGNEFFYANEDLFVGGSVVGIPVPEVAVGTVFTLNRSDQILTVIEDSGWAALESFPSILEVRSTGSTSRSCRYCSGWMCCQDLTESKVSVFVDDIAALRDPRLLVEGRFPNDNSGLIRTPADDAEVADAVLFRHTLDWTVPFEVRFIDAVTAETSDWHPVTPDEILVVSRGCTQTSRSSLFLFLFPLSFLAPLLLRRRRRGQGSAQ